MSEPTPPPPEGTKTTEQLRREAVEIVQRRRRGLPGYRGNTTPPPAAAPLEVAQRAILGGREALTAGNLAEAKLRADTAIGMASPGSEELPDAWVLRGDIFLNQRNLQAARDAYRRAMTLNPAHIPARIGLAESYRLGNLHVRAIPILLETIPMLGDPEARTHLRLVLAECYLANGQREAAQRVLRTAERPRSLSTSERLRAALTMLIPGHPISWLLLALVLLAGITFSLSANIGAGLLALLLSLLVYGLFQWWHTPAR